jgi:branched-subunit amino acid transport protein
MTTWLIIVGMGLVTYAIRLAPIALLERIEMPPLMRQALRFVPPAVLSALIAVELLRPAGVLDLSLSNTRLLAGVLATLIAWRTRNVLLTIGAGMIALWVLQALIRSG